LKRPELQVNLFEVPLPDKPFALQLRVLAKDETLQPFERLLPDSATGERRAVLVTASLDKSSYREEFVAAKDLPPFLIECLLEHGLRAALVRAGKDIETALTSFVAFDPKDTVATSEKFLELRKGVEFRSDHVSFDRRHTFGFFASLKVRLRFTIDLLDSKLVDAAIGKEVHTNSAASHRRMILQSVDSKSKTARLYDDQEDATHEVAFSQVTVPANRPILAHYCQSIGKPQLAQQLIHQSQEASFRLTRSGNKNRGWLKSELEFVRAWLLHASSGGRLVFPIPNTAQDVYLSATPATARFIEQ